jgi:Domain of unknown function (DUF4863)
MDIDSFTGLIAGVTHRIRGRPLDKDLERFLNAEFPPTSSEFRNIFEACRTGIAEGWMCSRTAGGIRYGRVVKSTAVLDEHSVDVVDMTDVVGPYHAHPHGEIDMVMPIAGDARFDGHGAGWVVYPANSAHKPTVSGGQAIVLYLLPQGAIDFTPPSSGSEGIKS